MPAMSRRSIGVLVVIAFLLVAITLSRYNKRYPENNSRYVTMSTMTSGTSASPRERLVEAALTVLERDGPAALQARRLANEIGSSTMAVYTHFGGMPKLIEAMVREGLARFAEHVRRVPETDDPMADLISGGLAYGEFALQNPQLYRLLFGLGGSGRVGRPAWEAAMLWDLAEGVDALSVLVRAVERTIDAGRIRPQDARSVAMQILSTTHGFVLLMVGGLIDSQGFTDVMVPLAVNLMVGLGDKRGRVERSLSAAIAARTR